MARRSSLGHARLALTPAAAPILLEIWVTTASDGRWDVRATIVRAPNGPDSADLPVDIAVPGDDLREPGALDPNQALALYADISHGVFAAEAGPPTFPVKVVAARAVAPTSRTPGRFASRWRRRRWLAVGAAASAGLVIAAMLSRPPHSGQPSAPLIMNPPATTTATIPSTLALVSVASGVAGNPCRHFLEAAGDALGSNPQEYARIIGSASAELDRALDAEVVAQLNSVRATTQDRQGQAHNADPMLETRLQQLGLAAAVGATAPCSGHTAAPSSP